MSEARSIAVKCQLDQIAVARRALKPFDQMLTWTRWDEKEREMVILVSLEDVKPAERDDQVEIILAALEHAGCRRAQTEAPPSPPARTS